MSIFIALGAIQNPGPFVVGALNVGSRITYSIKEEVYVNNILFCIVTVTRTNIEADEELDIGLRDLI